MYALVIVYFGWIFFRADNLRAAFHYIEGLFVFDNTSWMLAKQYINSESIFFMAIGVLFSTPLFSYIERKCHRALVDGIIISAFVFAIFWLVGRGFSPFLYFRF